jgi:TonB family protein
VLSYLASALWQLPLIVLVAWVAARGVRALGARSEHRVWCAALYFGVWLPTLSRPMLLVCMAAVQDVWMACLAVLHGGTIQTASHVRVELQRGVVQHSGALSGPLLHTVLATYSALLGVGVVRLVSAAWGVRRLRREAVPFETAAATEWLLTEWSRLQTRFALPHAAIALSSAVWGPVTIGDRRPLVLVPSAWLGTVADEDMVAALAHECAHVVRRDFRNNLMLRWLALPLVWHPALWLVQARVAETREMVCDEQAAEVVAGGGRYARSLLRLAATLLDGPRSTNLYAIGVFDANQLERRMMRVTEKKHRVSRWIQVAAIGAVAGLGVSVCGAAMAFHTNIALQESAPADAARSVPPGVMAGQILSRVSPVYPADAKRAKVQGAVVLAAVIGKDGSITKLDAVSGPKELQQSALDAVRQWKYKPYLLNGEPVEVETKITVTYSLQH